MVSFDPIVVIFYFKSSDDRSSSPQIKLDKYERITLDYQLDQMRKNRYISEDFDYMNIIRDNDDKKAENERVKKEVNLAIERRKLAIERIKQTRKEKCAKLKRILYIISGWKNDFVYYSGF